MQPRKFGRYEILEELPRGAAGRAWLARDPREDREVTIRTVEALDAFPTAEREQAAARLLREARELERLSAPGFVPLLDSGEADGRVYLVFEHVAGTTLDAFCRKDGLLDAGTAAELIAGAAESLDPVHRAGLVHRDIRPAHLLRVGEREIRIAGFGLAVAGVVRGAQDDDGPAGPSYRSPEQVRDAPLDGRSDLFSLAVVLYELLTGQKAFPGETAASIVYRIVHEPAREPRDASHRVGPALMEFLGKALAKDPVERYATGGEFAQALRAAAAESPAATGAGAPAPGGGAQHPPPGSALPEAVAPAALRRRRGSLAPYIVSLAVVLVALAASAYFYRQRGETPAPVPAAPAVGTTSVQTEPPGLAVELSVDGEPTRTLADGERAELRFPLAPPFPVLRATSACRVAEHTIEPADDGGEVLLVVDPRELSWRVETPVDGAEVRVNGESAGRAPVDLTLDLCRANRLELLAADHRPATLEIPEAATRVQARALLAGLKLDPLPRGRLVFPEAPVPLVRYVDGRRLESGRRELEVTEGRHDIRIKNEAYWIDLSDSVDIAGGRATTVELRPPALTELVVQAFPANCKVELRRPGGRWQYLDETPTRKQLAAGMYDVRVTHNTSGESQVRRLELQPGPNPDARFSFGGRS